MLGLLDVFLLGLIVLGLALVLIFGGWLAVGALVLWLRRRREARGPDIVLNTVEAPILPPVPGRAYPRGPVQAQELIDRLVGRG